MRKLSISIVLLTMASGCAFRGLPGFSLARYVRANEGEQVRLVGAIGGGYGRETKPSAPGAREAEALLVPTVEVGGSYRLHELYGVSVTASPGMLSAEGQFRVGVREVAIGVIHGIGAGLSSVQSGTGMMGTSSDPTFQLNLIAGLFAQFRLDSQNFLLVGGRYVFDDIHGPGTGQRGQHWVGGGVGWLGQLFNFFGVGAEAHSGVIAPVNGSPALWYLLINATLSAAF